jgi:hypothetical protein
MTTEHGNCPDQTAGSRGPTNSVGKGVPSRTAQVGDPVRGKGADVPDRGTETGNPALPVLAHSGLPDAAEVHHLLKSLQGVSHEVRLNFIDTLRLLYDGSLFFELGYSSYHQYCDRELGLSRTTCYEYLRVAMALDCLPAARAIYAQGELSWEQLRAIGRVASADTENEWLEFAFREPVAVLLAEAREAVRTGRDSPRDRRFGLPNLLVDIKLRVTLEERERIRAAFKVVSAGAGPDLRGGPDAGAGQPSDGITDQRLPLLRWADGILSGAIPAQPAPTANGGVGTDGRAGTGASSAAARAVAVAPAQAILYRVCPRCRTATLDAEEGPISVGPERVAELEGASNRVVITADDERPAGALPPGQVDPPNDSQLTRKVLHRDGLRCANPGCGRTANLHAHHIVFRSEGGRTMMSNEVAVCDRCHALLHQGLLEVKGSPDEGLIWRPRPLDPTVKPRDGHQLSARLKDLAASDATGRYRAAGVLAFGARRRVRGRALE